LRLATEEDRARVLDLIRDAYAEFEPNVAAGDWVTMSNNLAAVVRRAPLGELLVVDVGGRLGGTVTYHPPGPKDYDRVPESWAVIRALGVDPRHRGQGLGRLLTEECLRRAQLDGAVAVGLHTAEIMVAAMSLYERMGFVRQRAFTHLNMRFWIYARYTDAHRP
jgi:ribosomal protein S18 acetylase RimI-like enzyme